MTPFSGKVMEVEEQEQAQNEARLKPWQRLLRRLALFANDGEEGQGLVEYGLVLLLVAVVVIAILVFLGPQIGSLFSAVSKGLS